MTPAGESQVLISASRVQEELLRVSWKHNPQQFLGAVRVAGNNIIAAAPVTQLCSATEQNHQEAFQK